MIDVCRKSVHLNEFGYIDGTKLNIRDRHRKRERERKWKNYVQKLNLIQLIVLHIFGAFASIPPE